MADEAYERDCDIPARSTAIEDQTEGLKANLRCERANNAAQREYRRKVLEDQD